MKKFKLLLCMLTVSQLIVAQDIFYEDENFDSTMLQVDSMSQDEIEQILSEMEEACNGGDSSICEIIEMTEACANGDQESCVTLFEQMHAELGDEDFENWDYEDEGFEFEDFDSTMLQVDSMSQDEIEQMLSEMEEACNGGDSSICEIIEMTEACANGDQESCVTLFEQMHAELGDEDFENWDYEDEYDEIYTNDNDTYFPWEDGFPGAENNEGFDSAIFDNMMSLIDSMDMEDDEMVLIMEQSDVLISIIDASGFEFIPTLVDGYLVFGPFNIEDLYSIFMGDMNGNGIGWGLLRPSGAEVVADGVISEPSELLNGMFTISASLSIEEHTTPLEVYSTTYFNLLGKEIKTLENGLYIKVMQTNKGQVAEKVYHQK